MEFSLSPEQDSFLASAIEYHNANNEALNENWGFEDFEEWGFNQETNTFFIRKKDNSIVEAKGQIYGSFSEPEGSWEWAWNNPMVEKNTSLDSHKAKEYGEQENLNYLTEGMIPVPGIVGATYLASICEKLNESQGVYIGEAGAIKIFIGLKQLTKKANKSE